MCVPEESSILVEFEIFHVVKHRLAFPYLSLCPGTRRKRGPDPAGMVGGDGKIHDAVVQSAERPDLNHEALALVRQGSFTPTPCNEKPDLHGVELTLQFQER